MDMELSFFLAKIQIWINMIPEVFRSGYVQPEELDLDPDA